MIRTFDLKNRVTFIKLCFHGLEHLLTGRVRSVCSFLVSSICLLFLKVLQKSMRGFSNELPIHSSGKVHTCGFPRWLGAGQVEREAEGEACGQRRMGKCPQGSLVGVRGFQAPEGTSCTVGRAGWRGWQMMTAAHEVSSLVLPLSICTNPPFGGKDFVFGLTL